MTRHLIDQMSRDPRHGQIAAVGALVLAGVIWLGFEMPWWRPAAALGAALAMQGRHDEADVYRRQAMVLQSRRRNASRGGAESPEEATH